MHPKLHRQELRGEKNKKKPFYNVIGSSVILALNHNNTLIMMGEVFNNPGKNAQMLRILCSAGVWIYLNLYICIHLYIYAYIYIYLNLSIYLYLYICLHISLYIEPCRWRYIKIDTVIYRHVKKCEIMLKAQVSKQCLTIHSSCNAKQYKPAPERNVRNNLSVISPKGKEIIPFLWHIHVCTTLFHPSFAHVPLFPGAFPPWRNQSCGWNTSNPTEAGSSPHLPTRTAWMGSQVKGKWKLFMNSTMEKSKFCSALYKPEEWIESLTWKAISQENWNNSMSGWREEPVCLVD